MTNTPIKQTRNVLANELGLTKELVREIVEQRVDKLLREFSVNALIEQATRDTVSEMAKADRHDWHSIRRIVASTAETYIRERLAVQLVDRLTKPN
jgi:hypothetical protein